MTANDQSRTKYRRSLFWLSALFAGFSAALIALQKASDLVAAGNKGALFGTDYWQTVGLQSGIALGTTALATVLVTLTVGAYQDRISETESARYKITESEGIIATFRSDNDPAFIAFVQDHIDNARDEIRALGLGLGFLAHNTLLLDKIRYRIRARPKLTTILQYGSASNTGVVARIDEEEEWNILHELEYDRNWVTRYPNTIRDRLRRGLTEPENARLRVEALPCLPMVSLLVIDEVVLVSPYGSPAMRGSETPWIAIRRNIASSQFGNFAAETLSTLDSIVDESTNI